jgi:hypothetical protein
MRAARIALPIVAGAMLYVGGAQAQLAAEQTREPHPGAAALAAAGNIFFAPVRFALFAVGTEIGGLVGWLPAGNETAARDIWSLPPFAGQSHLQPEMLYGEQALDFGTLEFHMHVTPP